MLPEGYFEQLLDRFEADPRLGVAGGAIYEQFDDEWRLLRTPAEQATAPARVYSHACFEAVGGVPERQASDPIASTYAACTGSALAHLRTSI